MPSEIRWLIEDRVVMIRDYGVYTVDEMKRGLAVLQEYLDRGTPPMYIIQDSRELERYPTSIQPLRSLMKPHPHVQHIVLINNPRKPTTRLITTLLVSMAGTDFTNVDHLREALETLQQLDPTLDAGESAS